MTRTAKTKRGKVVVLHRLVRVEGGWISYTMHKRGFAVSVFTPD